MILVFQVLLCIRPILPKSPNSCFKLKLCRPNLARNVFLHLQYEGHSNIKCPIYFQNKTHNTAVVHPLKSVLTLWNYFSLNLKHYSFSAKNYQNILWIFDCNGTLLVSWFSSLYNYASVPPDEWNYIKVSQQIYIFHNQSMDNKIFWSDYICRRWSFFVWRIERLRPARGSFLPVAMKLYNSSVWNHCSQHTFTPTYFIVNWLFFTLRDLQLLHASILFALCTEWCWLNGAQSYE